MPVFELQDLRPSHCWPARVKIQEGAILNIQGYPMLSFRIQISSLLTPVPQALE